MTDISVDYIDHMGSDLSVVNAARVSFDKVSEWEELCQCGAPRPCYASHCRMDQVLSDRDAKLIAYLAKNNHKSPFNHAFASFRVKAPIFVARQLVKHEYMPWNEQSRRYISSEPEFYTPPVWRKKADNVKQGSSDEPLSERFYSYDKLMADALKQYDFMLDLGVCPEQARMVLPASLMTTWVWSGSLFAIAKMYNLRIDSHTQYETRLVAEQIGAKMEELYPVSWNALTN